MGIEIAVIVVITLVMVIAIHSFLHKLVKFRMDESAIVNFFQDVEDSSQLFHNAETISKSTGLSADRIALICNKSEKFEKHAKDSALWCVK